MTDNQPYRQAQAYIYRGVNGFILKEKLKKLLEDMWSTDNRYSVPLGSV
jgi:hypothetical protein